MTESKNNEKKVLVEGLEKYYLIPLNIDELFVSLDKSVKKSKDYALILDAFVNNISAVNSVTSIPFALASASVHEHHFHRFNIAEQIRTLKITDEGNGRDPEVQKRRAPEAMRRAENSMKEFSASAEGQNIIIVDTSPVTEQIGVFCHVKKIRRTRFGEIGLTDSN